MSETLGSYLKRERERRGRTQQATADDAGIDRPHLSMIESGKIAWPNADIRRRIARALDLSPLDLLIAAGELSAEDVAGMARREPFAAGDPRRTLMERSAQLTDEDIAALLHMCDWFDAQRRSREPEPEQPRPLRAG
jgi:transcriptional regulator with XRE-family HTH domain